MSIVIRSITRCIPRLALAAVLLVPGVLSAAVVKPLIDIIDVGDDKGATLTVSSFTIDATAITISLGGGGLIDIPDETFTLTSTSGSFDFGTGLGMFSGNFSVGGGLLSGTFTDLEVEDDLIGGFDIFGAVDYTSGSLKGGLADGRLEGFFDLDLDLVTAELGPVVVPVPAAVWLFGSGLLGLVGIARRKAA